MGRGAPWRRAEARATDTVVRGPAESTEREGNNLKGFEDFYLKVKAITVLYVPYSLDIGRRVGGPTAAEGRGQGHGDGRERPRRELARHDAVAVRLLVVALGERKSTVRSHRWGRQQAAVERYGTYKTAQGQILALPLGSDCDGVG